MRQSRKSKKKRQQLISELQIPEEPSRTKRDATRAKGVHISAYVAGTLALVDNLIKEFDQTEANALVVDFKDDFGRVVCETESPLINNLVPQRFILRIWPG